MSEDDTDIFDEMERTVQSIFGEIDSLFDPQAKCLRPLYRIDASDEEVAVTFDLPCVESREDIDLISNGESLSIEAKIRKPVTLRVGGPFQRHMEFERFSKKINLPTKVDPNRAKATFRNGILAIRFPMRRAGNNVSIE